MKRINMEGNHLAIILVEQKKNKYGYTTDHSVYDALPDDAKAIITDFSFNVTGGIKGWPKLMNALKDGDWETVAEQYKRSLKGKLLGKRNDDLFEKYIEPNLPNNKVFNAVKESIDTPNLDIIRGASSSEIEHEVKNDRTYYD